MMILITRAKVMVLWSLTKTQSNFFFLNISNQTIPTTPAIFPIKFNVLEMGEKIQVKTSIVATRTKIHKLNARIIHYSTLFTTLELTLFMRVATLFIPLHRQHTHYTETLSQWTYTNSTTLEPQTHENTNTQTQTQTHWKFYFDGH